MSVLVAEKIQIWKQDVKYCLFQRNVVAFDWRNQKNLKLLIRADNRTVYEPITSQAQVQILPLRQIAGQYIFKKLLSSPFS